MDTTEIRRSDRINENIAAVDLCADFSCPKSRDDLSPCAISSIILATRFRLRKLPEVTLAHSGMPNRAARYGRTHFNSVTVIGVRSGSRFSRRRRSLFCDRRLSSSSPHDVFISSLGPDAQPNNR